MADYRSSALKMLSAAAIALCRFSELRGPPVMFSAQHFPAGWVSLFDMASFLRRSVVHWVESLFFFPAEGHFERSEQSSSIQAPACCKRTPPSPGIRASRVLKPPPTGLPGRRVGDLEGSGAGKVTRPGSQPLTRRSWPRLLEGTAGPCRPHEPIPAGAVSTLRGFPRIPGRT